mmetsp:Transcript_101302/g.253977  ORF Transcript_101302/g.253977 Transcript_101302/m.253977 type:complete len:230 (-) Transcript_101302:8-697(-)
MVSAASSATSPAASSAVPIGRSMTSAPGGAAKQHANGKSRITSPSRMLSAAAHPLPPPVASSWVTPTAGEIVAPLAINHSPRSWNACNESSADVLASRGVLPVRFQRPWSRPWLRAATAVVPNNAATAAAEAPVAASLVEASLASGVLQLTTAGVSVAEGMEALPGGGWPDGTRNVAVASPPILLLLPWPMQGPAPPPLPPTTNIQAPVAELTGRRINKKIWRQVHLPR